MSITPKSWGFEDEIINVDYCGKRMVINEKFHCSMHKHVKKDEVLMVGNEDGLLWFETGQNPDELTGIFMKHNDRIRIVPGLWHRFSAIQTTTIYEFSTHHEDSDSIRHSQSGKLTDTAYGELLKQYYAQINKDVVLNVEQAGRIADVLHKQGKVIGMCNGCFDLAHLGHAALIEQAKQRCDVLFVAINSDEAIRKLKGNNRPIIDFKGRYGMVAYNRFVDYVVMSEATDHVAVVAAIHPHVYISTAETKGNCPEAKAISEYGGKIVVLDRIPGYSTSDIVQRIIRLNQG
jgi:rfaE bifunctional protein nucleotidyltransferase chain/domain